MGSLRDNVPVPICRSAAEVRTIQNQFWFVVFDLGMDENKSNSKPLVTPIGIAIILGIFALFAFIATPNFVYSYRFNPKSACINNLRQIDAAKAQWALENNQTNLEVTVEWMTLQPYLGRCRDLNAIYCPLDPTQRYSNSYTIGNLQTKPKCKINPDHSIN